MSKLRQESSGRLALGCGNATLEMQYFLVVRLENVCATNGNSSCCTMACTLLFNHLSFGMYVFLGLLSR